MNLKLQVIALALIACSASATFRSFAEKKHVNVHGSTVTAKTGIEGLKQKYSIKTNEIKALKLFVAHSQEEGSKVKLGANPNHEEHIGIDNMVSKSWIAKKGCKDAKTKQPFHANPLGSTTSLKPTYECKNSCKYVMNNGAKLTSTLSIHDSTLAGGVKITGNDIKDTVVMDKITLADVHLVEATEVSNGASIHTLGGLSFANDVNSIPHALKAKSIVPKALWSTYFFRLHDVPSTINTKKNYDDIGRGFLTIGTTLPIPAKYWEKHTVPGGAKNWVLNLAAVTFGSKNLFTKGDIAIFTSNSQSITVPENQLKNIKAEILAKGGFTASQCTADLNDFSCNQCKDKAGSLPTFHFKFGAAQHSWSLKPEDYAFFETSDKCSFKIKTSGLVNTWTFGHYFMKRHYMAFDQDNNQIWLSTFPQADLEILSGYYANKFWAGAFGLLSNFTRFFGIVALAFMLFK